MTEAFRINGVDRGTIKMTAAIAELSIVDPETFKTLKYDPATETLQSFAKSQRGAESPGGPLPAQRSVDFNLMMLPKRVSLPVRLSLPHQNSEMPRPSGRIRH
ncbi:unnamed protein product [Gadus morhua 'NCC']